MKPPKAKSSESEATSKERPSAVFAVEGLNNLYPLLSTLKKRPDFVAASRARRQGTKGLMLQARARNDGVAHIRVGYTCSKKVGNAVARNRAKRRLREVARLVLTNQGQAGWDYVLVGRARETAAREFSDLTNDLRYALRKIHNVPKK